MKKNRIFIYLMITGLLAITACNNDFMDRYPLTSLSDEVFFNTVNDLKTYTNQFYPALNTEWIFQDDNASDNQVHRDRQSYIWNLDPVPPSGGGWGKDDWLPIRRCNYFLQRYHKATGNQSDINLYLGEILFFKSLYYYVKVARFGDVPWLTRDLNVDSEELFLPRDSRKLVVDSICENLDRAIRYLPEDMIQDRISRYAALTLKSRICLFEGTFRKYHGLGDYENMLRQAANAAQQVMASGKFALYSTGDPEHDLHSFFQLYYADMKESKEAIHYLNFVIGLRTHSKTRSVYEAVTGMSKDFAESFLMRTDGLPTALSPDYKGDATFDDEFINRDYRMKQIIYTSDNPILINADGSVVYEPTPLFNNFVPTGYRIYKLFSPRDKDREPYRCETSDPVYRYAEVLLNYAEAKAELGECDQAVIDQTINLIRDRVAMPRMTLPISFVDPNWPNWEVPVSPLINEIRRERRIELSVEGFRFNDLKRWKAGKLMNNPKTYQGARDPETGDYRIVYPGFTREWNDKLYLYPIPTNEMIYNKALTQNPGW